MLNDTDAQAVYEKIKGRIDFWSGVMDLPRRWSIEVRQERGQTPPAPHSDGDTQRYADVQVAWYDPDVVIRVYIDVIDDADDRTIDLIARHELSHILNSPMAGDALKTKDGFERSEYATELVSLAIQAAYDAGFRAGKESDAIIGTERSASG